MDDSPTLAIGLQAGERAPDMVLPNADGTPVRWYSQAGGVPTLLLMARDTSAAAVIELQPALADLDLAVHVVGPPALANSDISLPLLLDPEGKAATVYRTEGMAVAFFLDPNLRVQRSLGLDDPQALASAARAFEAQTRADTPAPREIGLQAPVLTIPDVLTATECGELMRVWEEEGNEATGVEASTQGSRGERLQSKKKRRRDHVVEDQARMQHLAQTVGRRVMPEVGRAFAYRATRFEGFKIACYEDSDRGFFSAHRDNLSPTTAHRRFALTLNLNDGFEGGQLRFPEFGPDLYKPPPGAALIFSCSHLHEVMDVTAGRRFVLLSFLFAGETRQTDPHAGHSHD